MHRRQPGTASCLASGIGAPQSSHVSRPGPLACALRARASDSSRWMASRSDAMSAASKAYPLSVALLVPSAPSSSSLRTRPSVSAAER